MGERRARLESPQRRGFLVIFGATAVGQLIGLVTAPVLSRVYSPADFGIFTAIFALTSTLGTIAALRLDMAVPLPASERTAHAVATLGLLAAGTTALVGSAVVAVFGRYIATGLGRPELMPWLWFVSPTAALLAGFLVLNQLAVRHRRYSAIGRRNLFQSMVLVSTQIGAGIGGLRPGGLMLGMAVGQAAGALSLLPGAGLLSPAGKAGRRPRMLWVALQRYRRFALVLAPSGLINVLGLQLPVLIMAYYYGTQVAGWLGLTQRVLGVPVTLIGTAVAQVYLGELTAIRRGRSAQTDALFHRASRHLALSSLPIAAVLLLVGPAAFSLIFGATWRTSGEYAQALALGLAAQLVAAPLSQTLTAFERQRLQLCWDVGRLVLTGGVTTACAIAGASAAAAIWAFGATLAVSYIASWVLSLCVVQHEARSVSPVPTSTHQGRETNRA